MLPVVLRREQNEDKVSGSIFELSSFLRFQVLVRDKSQVIELIKRKHMMPATSSRVALQSREQEREEEVKQKDELK